MMFKPARFLPGRALRALAASPAWLALLLALPAILPLAAPGYFFNAHDGHHSVFWLVEFDSAFRDGALWPVWAPDHVLGFGYPLWLVYAPLAYYVGEAFHLLGLGFTAAIKATWALGFIVGALGSYRLARRWWGEAAGLVASLAYTYAPYHLVDIYVRAALAEFAALAIFPWVLLAFAALWDDPRPRRAVGAALAVGALLLTHSIAPVTYLPLLGGFLLIEFAGDWLRGRKRGQGFRARLPSAGWAAAALILGILLAGIFLIPMLLERGYAGEAIWLKNTYDYKLHFVYLSQFLNPFWGFGYSVEGPGDGMSFQLGLLPFLGAVVGGIAALSARRGEATEDPTPARREAIFLIAASLIALFLMTSAARPIWDGLPLISLIQFPWRLLAVTTVTLALLAGAGGAWLEHQTTPAAGPRPAIGPFALILALAIVVMGYPTTRPELQPIRQSDESPLAVIEFEMRHPDMRGITRWSDRQPADADSPLLPVYLAGGPITKAAIVAGSGVIVAQDHTANTAHAVVRAEGDIRLRFYTYYFPGWTATVDGRPAEIAPDAPNGLIGLTLPPGEHDIRLRFGPTPVRQIAAGLSLLALAGVCALWVVGRKR